MSIKAAYLKLLAAHNRQMDLTRNNVTYSILVTPSNYSRKLSGPEEITIKGKEFVITKDTLTKAGFTGPLKRGDRLSDPDMGVNIISEVHEMFDFGGEIVGYRVRTS
jgi:hypothetical protein